MGAASDFEGCDAKRHNGIWIWGGMLLDLRRKTGVTIQNEVIWQNRVSSAAVIAQRENAEWASQATLK